MKTIIQNGHRLDVPGSTLTGREDVRYDGRIVSSKRSTLGATHVFDAEEEGEPVQYEVKIGTRWNCTAYCTVRRDGEMIFTDR